jgi:hypothetical protein
MIMLLFQFYSFSRTPIQAVTAGEIAFGVPMEAGLGTLGLFLTLMKGMIPLPSQEQSLCLFETVYDDIVYHPVS